MCVSEGHGEGEKGTDWLFSDQFSLSGHLCFIAEHYLNSLFWYLQQDGYVLDSIIMAGGYEFHFEILITEAIHLSSLCANKKLISIS